MLEMNDYSRATIADVAEKAGVSIATVSRVMNNTGQVAETTRMRVQTAINELRFMPHSAARVLASRRTNTLGLILSEISDSFFQPLLRGIEAAARENGYDLLIHCTRPYAERDAPTYPLGDHNADGLLIFADTFTEAEITRLYKTQFPLVLVHRTSPPGLNIPCVTVENKSGARKLVDYLIEQRGYRRIAFLTGPDGAEDSYWREMGYRESLAAHGIPFDTSLMGMGGFDENIVQPTVRKWLEEGLEMDAIFAGDDASAVGVIAVLKDAGISVPEAIAVVGFDDIPLARHLTPALTTVRAPTETVGREAVRQLVKLIRDGEADRLTLLPTELVIRRSCGCC
jgi:DNA-binding LacI/PurR family transcriptional regulator